MRSSHHLGASSLMHPQILSGGVQFLGIRSVSASVCHRRWDEARVNDPKDGVEWEPRPGCWRPRRLTAQAYQDTCGWWKEAAAGS